MSRMLLLTLLPGFLWSDCCLSVSAQPAAGSPLSAVSDDLPSTTQNVLLITLDGLRWQELFSGADESLLNKEDGGVRDIAALKDRFWRETPEERRTALMPFFWSAIAQQAAVFGDPSHDSQVTVTNGLNFSYPGYSEILCGFAAPEIDSNAKKNNQQVTVLEWLHLKPEFQGRIAAWCSWDVFPWIINQERSGIPVNAGWQSLDESWLSQHSNPQAVGIRQSLQTLDTLAAEVPQYFPDVRYDYWTFRGATACLRLQKPRVLYVSLGETDDWAHTGRYDLYLDSAYRNDQYIRQLWETVQSMPEYRDQTTLILTTDHGRGDNRVDWKNHGREIVDCEYIWIAVHGPNVVSRQHAGSRATQSQIAATAAASLGYDYCSDQPRAARPLPVFRTAVP